MGFPLAHRVNVILGAVQVRGELPRPLLVGYLQLALLPLDGVKPGLEGRAGAVVGLLGQASFDAPVLLRNKAQDFSLAVHRQAQSHGLDPTRRKAAPYLAPEDRAQTIAHQPVQNSPGLLGVYEVLVKLSRVGEGLPDGVLGNLVKDDAPYLGHVYFRPP